jgi:hypothetical protein
VLELDVLAWGRWFETADRHVGMDVLPDGVRVSTVFLALDHAFGGGRPILWETMIFGGPHDGYQDRYTSREAAEAGHARALALCRGRPPGATIPHAGTVITPEERDRMSRDGP